jgi:flagellar protein FliO/FliZ
MLIADIARMLAGLAVTLGLIGLCVVVMRRYGPETLKRFQGLNAGRERRLTVIETLVLDPARRLVLVRFDAEERLLLLGEGQVVCARPILPPHPAIAPEEA